MAKDLFIDLLYVEKVTDDKRTENQFKELLKGFKKQYLNTTPKYEIDFKKAYSNKRKYYLKLIENEYIKNFNQINDALDANSTADHLSFLYDNAHRKFLNYLTQIKNYISDNVIDESLSLKPIQNDKSDEAYIISFLKANAMMLFMELQERFSELSDAEIYTIEELHEVFFNEEPPLNKFIIKYEGDKIIPAKISIKPKSKLKTSFGYKGENKTNLLKLIESLQLKIDLLDNRTTVNQLLEVLTTNDYTKLDFKIYFEANTTAIRYFIDKIKHQFKDLKLSQIEKSDKFYTKNDNKLTAQNLSSSKQFNFKEKEIIDNIFKQMQ